MKKFLTLLLIVSMLTVSAASCSDSGNSDVSGDTTVNTGESAAETTTVNEGYDYSGIDYDGYSFRVLNIDEQFGCYIRADIGEQTGEMLDDSVYTRNRKAEEDMGIKIEEIIIGGGSVWSTGQIGLCEAFINNIMAGDDYCDVAILPIYFKPSVITDGYALDLLDIPELDLYAEYWDAPVNESLTVKDSLYTAAGPFSLMALDLTWGLLFNENMMNNLGLELPYQLVRDGKWTIEKFGEYAASAVSLNGDESFTPRADGNAVYGIAGHSHQPVVMLYSANVDFGERTPDGGMELTYGGERMFTVLDALSAVCKTGNGSIFYNNGGLDVPLGYMSMFAADRALFMTCELKSAMEERSMESTFGLVPMPKLNEAQEEYRSYVAYNTAFFVMPSTQKDTSRAGTILDALNYESYVQTLPVYYDVTLSQKGLRNEESIEMLKIIRDNRGADFIAVYSITADLNNNLANLFKWQGGDVSTVPSMLESARSAAEVKLKDIVDMMGK